MSAMDFVRKSLKTLVATIDYIQCRYEYDALSCTHLIEIDCVKDDVDDTIIKEAKRKLKREFIRQFPLDGILFVTENTLSQIKEANYVFTGQAYAQAQKLWDYTIHSEMQKISAEQYCFSGQEFKSITEVSTKPSTSVQGLIYSIAS